MCCVWNYTLITNHSCINEHLVHHLHSCEVLTEKEVVYLCNTVCAEFGENEERKKMGMMGKKMWGEHSGCTIMNPLTFTKLPNEEAGQLCTTQVVPLLLPGLGMGEIDSSPKLPWSSSKSRLCTQF